MRTPRVYQIERLSDFLEVPRHRRAALLAEFLGALDRAEEVVARAGRLARARGLPEPTVEEALGGFVWRDDGEPEVRVELVPEVAP